MARRKPFGHGRLALQKKRRAKMARDMAKQFLDALDLDRVESSGAVFARHTRRQEQKAFQFLKGFEGRVYTSKLCVAVVRKISQALPFRIASDPNTTWEEYLAAQAKRLQAVARRVRRMNHDTQPYVPASKIQRDLISLELEPVRFFFFFFFFFFVFSF